MPANFKKRMLSDYTGSQTSTEIEDQDSQRSTETPVKRLRLTSRTIQLDIQDLTDINLAREAIDDLRQQIETLAENRIAVAVDDLLDVSEKLRDLFMVFRDPELECNIIQAIGAVLCLPSGSACLIPLRQFFLKTLKELTSVTVRTVLLRTLLQAGLTYQENAAFCWHITSLFDKCIKHLQVLNKPILVAGCLDVIGDLIPFRNASRRYILYLWNKFERDTSNDIRIAAYQMLSRLSSRGFTLDFTMYNKLCVGLEDLCSSVRSCAMDLIYRISQKSPLQQVQKLQGGAGERMNLVDDVFCKICDRVNDWEIEIRAKAVTLLGKMDGVTIDYIVQTVDKKLMSDLRVKVAGHERQKQLYESGEWSSGRKWADDAPKERLQQEDVKLMSIGATGAFVLALEDQFQEVRAPAVISMAQLAAKHPTFGSTCAEFLVDMFNDEIHDVRLNALKMFPLLGQGVELREDQLEMVLTVLQDADLDIREGLRLILPSLMYSSAKLVKMVYNELLNNLKQYPSDHGYICACLAKLGVKNAKFVAEDAASYLTIHPFLHSAEPKSDDRVYVCAITLVCNAASVCPEIFKLFLDFHYRHYLLYRYKYPDWFPVLENVGNTALAVQLRQKSVAFSRVNLITHMMVLRRSLSSATNFDAICRSLTIASTELKAICEKDASLETAKYWLEQQFKFCVAFAQELRRFFESEWKTSLVLPGARSYTITESLKSVVDEMRTCFSGHSPEDFAALLELSVREKLLRILIHGERSGDLVDLGPIVLAELDDLKKRLSEMSINLPAWVGTLQEQPRIPEQVLFKLLEANVPVPDIASETLKKIKAEIKLPAGNEDYPATIVAGTIHRIPFEAVVEGAEDMKDVRICIVMPDNRRLLLMPAEKDVLRQNEQFIIKKDITISQTVWTSSAPLKIQLCKIIAGKSLQVSGIYQLIQDDDMKKIIVFGNSVAYHVAPVAVRHNT